MMPPAERTGPTAWARVATLFVEYGVRRGVPRAELLAAAGLDEPALADPDGRIPLVAIYDVLEAIERLTGDARFGLDLPLGLEIDTLDALGFLFITSETFGSAMERLLRYMRLWNEGEQIGLQIEPAQVRLTYEPYGPFRPAHVHMAQATLCDMVVNSPRFVPGLEFEQVRFRQERPRDAEAFERVFRVPVVFGCAANEARFSPRMLSLAIPDANAALCAFFERYASQKLNELPGRTTLIERLRALIRQQLTDGKVTLPELAPRLHMSARTLQRRLADEGTSLQTELEEVRRQQALYFLENGTPIAELSWLLGYSDPSVFHRAFKRWMGTSPEAWRSGHRAAPGAP